MAAGLALAGVGAAVPLAGAQTPDDAAAIDTLGLGDTALTVEWSVPAGLDAADITAYDIRYIPTSDDESVDANWTVEHGAWTAGPLYYLIDGLANGTSYDVQVRAVAATTRPWSQSVSATPADHGNAGTAATSFELAVPVGGSIGSAADRDYFEFTLTEGERAYIYTTGDTELTGELRATTGYVLREATPAPLITSEGNVFLWAHLASGFTSTTYRVSVSGRDGATGAYVLHSKVIPTASSFAEAIPAKLDGTAFSMLSPRATGGTEDEYFRLDLDRTADVLIRSEAVASEPGADDYPDVVGTLYDSQQDEVNRIDDGYLVDWRDFAFRERLSAGTHYIRVRGYYSARSGPIALHVHEVDEPGSSIGDAAQLEVGGVAAGQISTASDRDFFRIDLSEPTRVTLRGVSQTVGLRGDLLDSGGSSLGVNPAYGYYGFYGLYGLYGFHVHRTLPAGTYYLRVDSAGFDTSRGEQGTGPYAVAAYVNPGYTELLSTCAENPTGVGDPLFGCQWHLENKGQLGATAGIDINVVDAWDDADGSGTVIAIVDVGVDHAHEDLTANYDSSGSRSYLTPDITQGSVLHGTAVAGLAVAAAGDAGTRGVAYGAQFRDLNLLWNNTSVNVAHAMAHLAATTTVSNNSWGTPDGPGYQRVTRLWELAIEEGLSSGDAGRGTFYVWAGGNGGVSDNSNLEEYVSHYGVTAVCAVNAFGEQSRYSESGANLWVCAPSSDGADSPYLVTTSTSGGYTNRFGGTSGAAPQVSGVAALMRDVNPALTWRDIRLILASSAAKNDRYDTGWATGAATYENSSDTYEFNHKYGFGLVDADAAVDLAAGWTNVPAMVSSTAASTTATTTIPDNSSIVSQSVHLEATVGFVEYVTLDVLLDAERFRDLQLDLVSPSGAVSQLLVPLTSSFRDYGLDQADGAIRLSSARHLGEQAAGEWTVRVSDRNPGGEAAQLVGWSLTVYGHSSTPAQPEIAAFDGLTDPEALTVSWDAPRSSGSTPVTGYDVRHIRTDATGKDDDSNWTLIEDAAGSASRSYTIENLSPGVDYDIGVRAYNSEGDGPWSRSATARLGEARTAPRFATTETGERSVAERVPAGSPVGSPVAATDDDGDTLSYRLEGADASVFDINRSTGQISTRLALDYETNSGYEVIVVAADGTGFSDRVEVQIEVTDVNEPPIPVGYSSLSVFENHRRDFDWTFNAFDPEGDALRWSLRGVDSRHFRLTEGTSDLLYYFLGAGYQVLEFITEPDFENPADDDADNTYEFFIEVSDGVTRVIIRVDVRVRNVDEPPDLHGVTQIQVNENTFGALGTYVASDPEGDPIRWRVGGTDGEAFTIDGGTLRFRHAPDYEQPTDLEFQTATAGDNVYEVEVWAWDDLIANVLIVEVTVADIDEDGAVALSSRQPVLSTAIDATLSDPDGSISGLSWTWERSPDGSSSWSTIPGAASGSYTPVSGDVGRFLRAVAAYTDGNGAGKITRSAATVAVRATAPANKLPSFGASQTLARVVNENSKIGTSVGARVSAVDPDGDSLTYSLGGADAASFEIAATTGQLKTAAEMDFEADSSYTVTVSVSDGKDDDGDPDSSIDDTVTVEIRVADVNEPPELSGDSQFTQRENRLGPLGRLSASDPDNDLLHYVVVGTDAVKFRINSGGVLSFSSRPNYEQPGDRDRDNAYDIRVSVTDGRRTVSQPVTVIVTDVNEAPTLASRARFFAENDTSPVFTLEGDDPDGDDLVWSLGGTDADAFAIAQDGTLTFASAPDFEAPADADADNDYRATVTVDDGEFTATANIRVVVDDVDEPPVITGGPGSSSAPSAMEVDEGFDGVIARYEGMDPEGVALTWSLRSTDQGDMTIDGDGNLRFKNIPDFENPADAGRNNSYSFQVVAHDGSHRVAADVEIGVRNLDEAGSITFSSAQPQQDSDFTARLSDPDGIGSATRTWAWERSDDRSNWTEITGANAATYTPTTADIGHWLRATVTYTDNHGGGKQAQAHSAQSTRAAPDVNDPPEFPTTETGRRSVAENTPSDQDIGAPLTAYDADAADALTYTLSGADADAFSVDRATGQLRTSAPLDRETKPVYRLRLTVTDPSGESDALSVTVTITDVNEPPTLSGPGAVNFTENRVDEVARFNATDPEGRALSWTLRGTDAGEFTLRNGSLRFGVAPDFEMPADSGGGNDYEVIVEVSDDDSNLVALPVTVTVTGEDEPPVVSGASLLSHPENTVAVGTYHARDPEGAGIEWSLDGDDAGQFAITAEGMLSFLHTPDYEIPGDRNRNRSYEVTVVASAGLLSTGYAVTVELENRDDIGAITFSTDEPEEGVALVATLSDPDGGVSNAEWTWEHSTDQRSWSEISGAIAQSYTPTSSEVSRWLRASVVYADRHGPGKRQQAVTATQVAVASEVGPRIITPPEIDTRDGGGGGGGSEREPGTAVVIVANGWSPADIGVAAALSAQTPESAVVYTVGSRLSVSARDLLVDYLPGGVIVVGGPAAVSNGALAEMRRVSESDAVERITGETRSDTAAGVARRILAGSGAGATTVIVANGWSPADIGVAAALSARTPRSAVVYTQDATLPAPTRRLLSEHRPGRVVIVGGEAAVAPAVESGIREAVPRAAVERVSGATRTGTAAGVARQFLGPAESAVTEELTVIVANGWSPPDIGVAAALSARTTGSVVLYTSGSQLAAEAEAVLREYQPARMVFIGGTAAISDVVKRQARAAAPDAIAPRFSGTTRTHTAALVARRILGNP